MTKRNITKLFAVAILAAGTPALASPDKPVSQQQANPVKPRQLPNGRPACGNTMSKTRLSTACQDQLAARPAPTPRPAAPPPALSPVARRILAIFGITDVTKATPVGRPRELRDGRPANGNIPSRMSRSSEEPREIPRETPREPNAN